ncbi:hypothetical protein KUF71_000968 [Frankliniella fusca]|uniref:Transposase domain-containing protein n=1 Tax=Frankliniella fusca TaxID=407009 RepID=A0AAE1LFM9_9NEOP|nr:hypothetical protein KUF71_000968 [Frankliniella fusca]
MPRSTQHRLEQEQELEQENIADGQDVEDNENIESAENSAEGMSNNEAADVDISISAGEGLLNSNYSNHSNLSPRSDQDLVENMENADGVDIVIDAGDGVEDHWFDVQEAMIADNNDINNVNENVPDAADLVRGPGQSEPLPFDSKPKKRENLDHPLFPGISATKFECLLAIFHFAMRHDLSMTGVVDLLKMINTILGEEVLPESEFIFKDVFRSTFLLEYHFYCSTCFRYLGEYKSFINATSKCDVCDNINSVNSLKSSNFFVYIPMEQQLRSLFESNPDIMDLLGHRFNRNVSPDQISDIFDGSVYKHHSREGEILSDVNNISITFNTDGSPVFKSGKNTMYPIQFRVNEFPPEIRSERWNCMVAGIWFFQTDPEMTTFLKPFVKESSKLYEKGFKWCRGEEVVTSRVLTLNCVLDSVAKPKVQAVKHFVGHFGCCYCLHPGIKIVGHPHPRFLMQENISLNEMTFESTYDVSQRDLESDEIVQVYHVHDRNEEDTRQAMQDVSSSDDMNLSINGVIGKSVLFPLTFMSLVFGLTLDYMHAILLGCCRLSLSLQLGKSSRGKPYFIGDKLGLINRRLLSIAPPSNISRRPRSLTFMGDWKANEWRNFLLYYSLPCIIGIQKPESYANILRIFDITSPQNQNAYVMCRKINVNSRRFIVNHVTGACAPHIKICPIVVFGDLTIVPSSHITSKVILIDNPQNPETYVIDMLKNYEKD